MNSFPPSNRFLTRFKQWLHRLNISSKISFGYALTLGIALTGTIAGIAIGETYQQHSRNLIQDALQEINLLHKLQTDLLKSKSLEQELPHLLDKPELFRQRYALYQERTSQLKQTWREFQSSYTNPKVEESAQEQEAFEKLRQDYDGFVTNYFQQTKAIFQQLNQRRFTPAEIEAIHAKLVDLDSSPLAVKLTKFVADIDKAVAVINEEVEEAEEALDTFARIRLQIIVVSMLISVVLAVIITLCTSQALIRPLQSVTKVAQQATQESNFELQAPVTTTDEVGIVATVLNQLIQKVRQLLAEQEKAQEQLEQYNHTLEQKVKERTEELNQNNARFQRLARNIPGVIYQYVLHGDGSDEFTYISPGCREIYELSPEELLQDFSVVWAMIHPLDVEAVNKANTRSAQTLEPFDIEFRLIPPSGQIKWVYAKSHPQPQENGDLVFDGMIMNISLRKQAEEKLLRTKALLASAQRLAHVGSWEYDLESEKFFWSEETFRIYGINPTHGEPSLAEHFRFVHPNDRAKFEQSFSHLVTKGANQEIEYQIVQPSGSVRYLEARGSALFNDGGQVTKIFGSVLDITSRKSAESEQKRQEAELKRAKEEAEIANEAKSYFLARMSHELRTPLNSILGFTQIMHDSTCNQPEHQEYIDIINQNGQHLLSLVNDVLSMSKIEAGKIKLNSDSFNLYHLLNSLEDTLRLKASAKKLSLTFEIAPDLPQYIITDSSKLRQVLLNLLSNAIKFTNFGHVTLRASVIGSQEKESKIYFEVIDTGRGISSSEIGNLFSAFVQTETGRCHQEGTGLGLAISRKFVQLMGGDITVKSVVGRGSVFAFDICVQRGLPIPTATSNHRVKSLAPNQPTYRLLVVDDTREHRQLMTKILAPVGFEVQEAENGQQALELWQSWYPHVIFMDMQMPVMNGYDATQAIKAEDLGQATVIIAVTASALDNEREIILSSGCDGFISKPFRSSEIFDILAQCLGVQYTYFETAPVEQNSPESFSLTKSDLAVMPDDWVQKLHSAACSCSDESIFQLLSEIPPENTILLLTLREMAYNFKFDEIIALTT